jgi:hypothetical protein
MTARVATCLTALGLLALGACTPASAPDSPPIATMHRNQCGRCHNPPEPGTRSREQVESAATRHARRVRLTHEQWSAMIEYLARESN